MKNQIQWDWKEAVGQWGKDKIIQDVLQDNYTDSTIFILAKREVFQIINKSSFNFVTCDGGRLFDEVYYLAVETTKKQILRYQNGKKSFLSENNCPLTGQQIVQKIISRIANNIRNLYDPRYKESIPRTRNPLQALYDFSLKIESEYLDPLSILLAEEDEDDEEILNLLIEQIDSKSIKDIFK